MLPIACSGLPPPPERDAYLRSRLEQFYAEIKDYRPGTIRTQMEETGKERSRWGERGGGEGVRGTGGGGAQGC